MKKATALITLVIVSIVISNCSVAEDIKETADALECANLIRKIDEKYDKEDRDCSDIKSDANKILSTCKDQLTTEQKEQLEFYSANCDVAN